MGSYVRVLVCARDWLPNFTITGNIEEPRSSITWNIHTFLSHTHFFSYKDTFKKIIVLQALSVCVSSLSFFEVTQYEPEKIFPLTVCLGVLLCVEGDPNCELSRWLIMGGATAWGCKLLPVILTESEMWPVNAQLLRE